MNRCFFFSYRKCAGPVGGGRGVTYKLYDANRKYSLIPNCYYMFLDTQFSGDDLKIEFNPNAAKNNNNAVVSKFINAGGLITITKYNLKLKNACHWMKDLGDKYNFTEDDCFVFHDFESAYAFIKTYNFSNTMLVYHQQGSLYSEWKSFNGKDSEQYRKYLVKKFNFILDRISTLAFPSKGAAESLVASESLLNDSVHKKGFQVLYNGFTPPEVLACPSHEISDLVDFLQDYDGLKFITVAALNQAKGVERIPCYLAKIREKYPELVWVIVGNGIKAQELSAEIEKYNLSNTVCWIKNPLKHDDILNLFSMTDFYILFHRFSIFDYATIEAMSFGNVPVLTPVGGNKEVVLGDNGILVDDVENAEGIFNLIDKMPLD